MKPEHRSLVDAKLIIARGIIQTFNTKRAAAKATHDKTDKKPKK